MIIFAIALTAAAARDYTARDYRAVGQCVARSNPRAAHRALSAGPGEATGPLDQSFTRCGAHDDAARPLLLGATAEAMIRRYHAETDFAGMYRPTTGDQRSVELMRRGTGAWSQTDAVGTCVTRFAPRQSQALFRTRPGAGDEEKAFRSLGDALRSCVDTGSLLRTTRAALRAGIARAFYRVYVAPVSDYGL